jgi:iron complex outermembrane recepter protein
MAATHVCCMVVGLMSLATALMAQTAAGIVEGRVFNPASGEYVENARVTVEGTAVETFTDATGQYRLTNVPPGTARIKAFRTGSAVQVQEVAVAAGAASRLDFNLAGMDFRPGGDTVQLEEFVVGASREMDGAAIAINTQRFAPNFMNVVAADEFGAVASGNVGEILQTVPGIAIGLGGLGAPFTVSMNGVPSNNVPLTIGGFSLANAANGTTRTVGLHQISINNMARVEVSYTPTPESSGAALAGSVNLVPRGAFERSKPVYHYTVALLMRDRNRSFSKSPGSQREPTRTVFPSIDLAAVVPLNERFGFTVSASTFAAYIPQAFSQNTWRGASAATNGTTLPDTTPDRPYLTDYAVRDGAALQQRSTFGTTVDVKLSRNDRLSLSFQYGRYFDRSANQMLSFFVNRVAPGGFTPTSTRGIAGVGEVRMTNNAFKWSDSLYMPSVTYRHDGPVWKSEVAGGFSRSKRNRSDLANGYFNNVQARRQGVTISFDDIYYLRPRVITVTDGSGAAVDPFSIETYTVNTANSNVLNASDLQRNLFANIRRDFFTGVPFTVKAGMDVRQAIRDIRADNPTYTFVGADGRAGTADDNATAVFDPFRSQRPMPFGFPSLQRVSNDALYDDFRSNPRHFTLNEATRYTSGVQQSKHAEEIVSSLYVRTDAQLLRGRLKLVGGVRAEQTNAKGEGQLIDASRNFRRDGSGRVIRNAAGAPLTITDNPLERLQLTNVDRGLRAEKEYLRWFPSLNASYNVRDNLIARAGYFWSIGRPDFAQYAGSLTLPDVESPPAPGNRIAVNNAGIKAWSARTAKVAMEYYFAQVGLISVSGFHREIENFFAATVLTPTPEFLGLYGLDPGIYGSYDVATQYNLSSPVRMTGLDLNYKQALTFLPPWARGVQVFANASTLRAVGDEAANFAGFIPRTANWGISLAREKYNLRMRWNYNGRARRALVAAGRSIEPGTYNWGAQRLLFTLSGEYLFRPNVAVFANLSNLLDAPADVQTFGPSTPEHAQFRQRQTFGSMWTFGVRGSF